MKAEKTTRISKYALFLQGVLMVILVLLTGFTSAAVRPQLTRIVAYSNEKETPVEVINDGSEAYLVQSWLEDEQGKDTDLPLVLTPPVMKLEGKKQGKLRLVVITSGIPQDRESVYWLSLQEIPPKAQNINNKLVVAIRSRLKVFVRPEGLTSEGARDAAKQLRWRISQTGDRRCLEATNPTAYYISFGELSVRGKGHQANRPENKHEMVPPKGNWCYMLPEGTGSYPLNITWSAVHDWGGAGEELKAVVIP